MENKNFIYHLIEQDHQNNLDELQKNELKSWLALSPDNVAEYNEIIKLFIYSDRLVSMKNIDSDRDLLKVKKKFNQGMDVRKLVVMFQKVAAILIVPLLLYSVWTIVGLNKSADRVSIMKTTETAWGVRSQLQLSDGTTVWMNSGSKLTYPDEFQGDSREVKLVGEAYFHVKSDRKHPFYVDLDGYKVKAVGTSFNISNYPVDREITTYLEHGKVSLLNYTKEAQFESVQLNETETIILNKAKKQYRIQKTGGAKSLAWIEGTLVFNNDSLNDVVLRLGRWYNVEVTIDDELSKSGYVFTATFKKETLEEALKLLSLTSPITYQIIAGTQLEDSSFSKRKVIISKKR